MHRLALSESRRLLLATAASALLSLATTASFAQPDPPAQAGRISYISGDVSFQPVGSDDWGQAVPNSPLGPGDRVFTDANGRAEIQVGQTFVRIGPSSDVSLVDSTQYGIYLGMAQGSLHIRCNGLWKNQQVYVNTPSGTSALTRAGELRVDVIPDQNAALFTSIGSDLDITGANGFAQWIGPGQALELVGSNPVVPQWMQPSDWDALDNWSRQRDQQIAQAVSYQYVSQEMPGAYELDAAGTWVPGTPYGPIWFPNNVQPGWAPYHYGHWVNRPPWGWVWVADESWGYAPFHYGRWVSYNGRWGWVAGPPAAHPVWSPAMVVFAGGIRVGGVGVSAWFPLGPGEVYRPWYPVSPRYVDEINRSNISESPRVHVQTTYVNVNVVNVTYVNRTTAVTAVSHADFAAGRPAHETAVVVDPRQFEHVQPLERPEPQPTRQSLVGHPPVRPVPVAAARPVLINNNGMAVVAKPGVQPVAPPLKPAPQVRTLPGHAVVAPPANAGTPHPPSGTPPIAAQPEPRPAPAATVPTKTAPAAALPGKPATAPPPTSAPPLTHPAAPVAPASPKQAVKPPVEPEVKTPPDSQGKPTVEPHEKPPTPAPVKPAVEPAAPPKQAKPGTTPPPKTDKNSKDKDTKSAT